MQTTHHIQKQILEVVLPNRKDHKRIAQKVKSVYQERMLPQMTALFDDLLPNGQVLILDKLELEIRGVSEKEMRNKLPEKVMVALEKAIKKQLEQAQKITNQTNERQNAVFKTKAQAIEDAFVYFIEYGHFPQWWKPQDHKVIENHLLTLSTKKLQSLFVPLLKKKRSAKRLLWQCSSRFWVEVLALFKAEQLESAFFENHPQKKTRQLFILQQLFQKNTSTAIKHIQHELTSNNTLAIEEIQKEKLDKTSTAQTIYIENAGLVLIAPFLERFFEKLQLTKNYSFQDESSQQRAVLLTEYLVSKRPQVSEGELTLNKIVCNYPLEESLPYELILNEQEKKECQNLLNAVIKHWRVLKNTSPDELRGMFLKRKGRLSTTPDGWKLKVEKQTADILLNQLPWAISIVKLEWMEKMVRVEWN